MTFDAEKTLKKAAELKHEEEMVLAVNIVDLIGKEFKKHDKCYRDYTRVIYSEFKEQQQSVYDSGNYEAVCKIIADQVIGELKCVSMETLITAYGIGHNHPQYRLKLKNRLLKTYGDDLLFLSPNYYSAQVVISSKCLQEQNISDENIVVKSADILRKNILNNIENEEKLTWPPTVEQLENEKRSPPQLLLQFLHRILHGDNNHHIIGEKKILYI